MATTPPKNPTIIGSTTDSAKGATTVASPPP